MIVVSDIFFHIDVNNAFLSWEAVNLINNNKYIEFNNEKVYDIRNVYSIICGDPKKRTGIVLAKSELAKKSGVKTGEPIFEALKKCPNLLMIHPNFNVYQEMSRKMKTLLEKYTDQIEQYSIDEFFVKCPNFLGSYKDIAKTIQEDIFTTLKFTVNIGISDVKVLAKIASDFEKPNKIHTLFKAEIKEKMWPLRIEDMFFLGKKGAKKLRNIGIDTIGKLANANDELLKSILHSQGTLLKNYANGIDNSDIIINRKDNIKSIGNSKTFEKDLTDLNELNTVLYEVINISSKRLRDKKLKARTITISLKNSNFQTYSSSSSFITPINTTKDIYEASKYILKKCYRNDSIRLIGISFSNLESNDTFQLNMFENFNQTNFKLDKIIDNINSKFDNSNIVTRGSLIKKK